MRCSEASRLVQDPLVGTAPAETELIIVEQPGPWGKHAIDDSRLPQDLREELKQLPAHSKAYIARHPDRRHIEQRHCWRLYRDFNGRARFETAKLASGMAISQASWEPTSAIPTFVCTNGARDRCCAELGRSALMYALGQVENRQTLWEVSHLGGHRFAPTAIHGELLFGYLTSDDLVLLASGGTPEALQEKCRGAFGYHPAAQAALLWDWTRVGFDPGAHATTLPVGAESWDVVLDVSGSDESLTVRVKQETSAARIPSCGKPAEPGKNYRVCP